MNNTIEEYNNGGLMNKPFMDASTLVNLFTSSTGTGVGSFSLPKEKIINLAVEQTINTWLVDNDPADTETYIRDELARKLAKQLIEEDLIQIQSDEDMDAMKTTFRAKVKVVQE